MVLFFENHVDRIELSEVERIKDNWDKIDLLYRLEPEDKIRVALLYQEAFNKIVDEPTDKYKKNEMFQTLILPAIRRVYNSCLENDEKNIGKELKQELLELINVDNIMERLFTLTNMFTYDMLKSVFPNIDGEAELLVLFEKNEYWGIRKTLREKTNG